MSLDDEDVILLKTSNDLLQAEVAALLVDALGANAFALDDSTLWFVKSGRIGQIALLYAQTSQSGELTEFPIAWEDDGINDVMCPPRLLVQAGMPTSIKAWDWRRSAFAANAGFAIAGVTEMFDDLADDLDALPDRRQMLSDLVKIPESTSPILFAGYCAEYTFDPDKALFQIPDTISSQAVFDMMLATYKEFGDDQLAARGWIKPGHPGFPMSMAMAFALTPPDRRQHPFRLVANLHKVSALAAFLEKAFDCELSVREAFDSITFKRGSSSSHRKLRVVSHYQSQPKGWSLD